MKFFKSTSASSLIPACLGRACLGRACSAASIPVVSLFALQVFGLAVATQEVVAQSEEISIKSFTATQQSMEPAMGQASGKSIFSGEDSKLLPREKLAVELNEKGVELVMQGAQREGIAKIKQALAHDPANTTILYNLAGLYLAQNQSVAAMEVMEEALRLEPEEVTFLERMAESALLSNNVSVAVSSFEKLASIEKDNGEVMLKLGTLYAMEKEWAKAEESLLLAKEKLDDDKRVLKNLANVYVVQSKYELAIPLLQQVRKQELSAENDIALAMAYEGLGDLPKAVLHYENAQAQGEKGEDLQRHIERLKSLK